MTPFLLGIAATASPLAATKTATMATITAGDGRGIRASRRMSQVAPQTTVPAAQVGNQPAFWAPPPATMRRPCGPARSLLAAALQYARRHAPRCRIEEQRALPQPGESESVKWARLRPDVRRGIV